MFYTSRWVPTVWNLTVQESGTDDWVIWIKQLWSGLQRRQWANSMMYAMCAKLPRLKRLQYQEWHRPKQKRSQKDWSQTWWDFSEWSRCLAGFRFFIVFADQYTKFVFVDLLGAKSDALASLKKFVLSVSTPKNLRQDNAKELPSDQFKMYCLDAGIPRKKTLRETPQRNRVGWEVQQDNAGDGKMLTLWLWSSRDDVGRSNSPLNKDQKLVVRPREEKCPAELMRGMKPKLSIIKLSIFGCTIFMSKRDRDVSKLEAMALEGKFLGYTEVDNGYLVYVPNTRKVIAVHQEVRSGLNPWQHRDAGPTTWEVTATGDLALRRWSSRRWQQRETGHIYCKKRAVAWRRDREHSGNDTETWCLRCWGNRTEWRIYCNKRESPTLGVKETQWNGGLLTVRDSWLLCRGMEQADRAEPRR